MVTDQDITKLRQTFATQVSLDALSGRVDTLSDRVDLLTGRVDVLTERVDVLADKVDTLTDKVDVLQYKFDVMDEKMDYLITGMDRLTGLYQVSMDEHRAGAQVLARHDRQIVVLARATKTSFPD